MDNSKKPGLTAKLRIHINTDREASCASPSITDARLTPLDCAMPVPLQRPSGWQLAWWRMMLWRANEHGACRFITPVPRRPSAKLTDEHMREREKKILKTNVGKHKHSFTPLSLRLSHFASVSVTLATKYHPDLVFSERGAAANKHHENPDPSLLLYRPFPRHPLTLRSCRSAHRFSAQISGQNNEPAASQAAEITAEEANSSLPGIHIVAALQRDRLRQISSWRLEGWIWWSHMASGNSSSRSLAPISASLIV